MLGGAFDLSIDHGLPQSHRIDRRSQVRNLSSQGRNALSLRLILYSQCRNALSLSCDLIDESLSTIETVLMSSSKNQHAVLIIEGHLELVAEDDAPKRLRIPRGNQG